MATEKITKVFISLGKFKRKTSNGKDEEIEQFIVMREAYAKFVGATYTKDTPAPRTVTIGTGKRAGRTYTVQVSASTSGTPYKFGFAAGNKLVGKPPKLKPRIKWVSFYVPKGVNLKQFMSIIFTKISKKPILLKTPSGATTRIQAAK